MIANQVTTSSGRVRVVCGHCDRKSRPVDGAIEAFGLLWSIGRGWSEAPYPSGYVHPDGTTGSLWACPSCNRRLGRGAALPPSPARAVRREFYARVAALRAAS